MPLRPDYTAPTPAGGKTYDPIPEDMYQWEIVDFTEAEDTFKGETKQVLKIEVVCLDKDYTFDGPINGEQEARGRRLWPTVTPYVSPAKEDKSASNFYVIAKACFGRDLTAAECESVRNDPEQLVGKQFKATALLKVAGPNAKNPGKEYNSLNVKSAIRVNRQLPSYDKNVEGKQTVSAVSAGGAGNDSDDVPF